MINRQIGYIVNESMVPVSEFEIVEQGHRVTAKGIVQTGNQTNRNGRLYTTQDLVKEINAPRQQELIRTGNMLGEAGHPITTDLLRQQTIDPKCVCVRYLEFWNEGDDIFSKFKGTNNDLGNAFDMDLREGILPAFSYRALGTIEETSRGAVVTNLKMITYDYVIYPSHPTAYTSGLVTESSTMLKESNVSKLVEADKLDGTKSFITEFTNQQALESIKKLNETGAGDYLRDQSKNFNLLKEFFDITKSASVDILPGNKVAITESGIGVIVMDMDDYIQKEFISYTTKL